MPILTLDQNSQRAEVICIRYQDSGGPLDPYTVRVDEIKSEPKTKPHQIARLYANAETGEHWWEVETKPVMSKYEFFSMIPVESRKALRCGEVPEEIADAMFMLGFMNEVHFDSGEAAAILAWVDKQ